MRVFDISLPDAPDSEERVFIRVQQSLMTKIWIRCVGAGNHLEHAWQRATGTRAEIHRIKTYQWARMYHNRAQELEHLNGLQLLFTLLYTPVLLLLYCRDKSVWCWAVCTTNYTDELHTQAKKLFVWTNTYRMSTFIIKIGSPYWAMKYNRQKVVKQEHLSKLEPSLMLLLMSF